MVLGYITRITCFLFCAEKKIKKSRWKKRRTWFSRRTRHSSSRSDRRSHTPSSVMIGATYKSESVFGFRGQVRPRRSDLWKCARDSRLFCLRTASKTARRVRASGIARSWAFFGSAKPRYRAGNIRKSAAPFQKARIRRFARNAENPAARSARGYWFCPCRSGMRF